MSIAALIRRMTDAGAPPEAIAIAVEEIEAIQLSLDARRTVDRERKREQRERLKSANVTGQSGDMSANVPPASEDKGSLEVSPHTPLPKPSKSPPFNPPKSKGVEPPDWMPPGEWAAFKEMRRKMRGVPFTETAERTVIGKIAKLKAEGHDPAKLLSKAVERGHRTVFEDETTKGAVGKSAPLSAQQLRERAEWFIRHGQQDRAEECRKKAVQIEQRTAA